MTLTTINPGVDTGLSTKLNNNFEYCATDIYTRDLTPVSTSATATSSLKSVTVPANTFSRIMYVTVGFNVKGTDGSANGSNGSVYLYVGGSLIMTISSEANASDPSTNSDSKGGSIRVPFRGPTDVDLTGSVVVEIKGSNTVFHGSTVTGSASCTYLIIEGI